MTEETKNKALLRSLGLGMILAGPLAIATSATAYTDPPWTSSASGEAESEAEGQSQAEARGQAESEAEAAGEAEAEGNAEGEAEAEAEGEAESTYDGLGALDYLPIRK